MQIGEVIRKYRKERSLTQEEMAKRLGVTAPAVNKWENGNSLPDILLLAPIARLLNISLDSLLSFQEELTEEEVNCMINEAGIRLRKEPYEEVFQWARKKLEEYPNCESLNLWMAEIFTAGCNPGDPNADYYDEYFSKCYVRVLDSQNEDLKNAAADALFNFYLRKGEYEKAEEYLVYFPKQSPERKRKQAAIYSRTERIKEAYKSYEELLFSGFQTTNLVFHSIYLLAMRENNTEKAHMIVEKQKQLAKLFDMGEYQEISPALELAAAEKDVTQTLEIMERMLASMEELNAFCRSPLYEHMVFKELRAEFLEAMKNDLLDNFRDDEAFGFIKEENRWKELVNNKFS